MSKRPEKKSETIEVRVSYSEKLAFMDACKQAGTTASHAIRGYIDDFLHPGRGEKERKRLYAGIGVLALLSLALAWKLVTTDQQRITGSSIILNSLDKNGDGVISAADVSDNDAEEDTIKWLIEAADQNGDKKLNEVELSNLSKIVFEPEGRADTPPDNRRDQIVVIPAGLSPEEREAYLKELGIDQQVSPEDRERLLRLIEALSPESLGHNNN